MAWTAPRTWVTDEVVTPALFNTHIRDNELFLDTHAHGGGSGDGSSSLGDLVKETFTDAAAPAAPGASKTVIFAESGVPKYRAGAAGATKILSDEDHVHTPQQTAISDVEEADATLGSSTFRYVVSWTGPNNEQDILTTSPTWSGSNKSRALSGVAVLAASAAAAFNTRLYINAVEVANDSLALPAPATFNKYASRAVRYLETNATSGQATKITGEITPSDTVFEAGAGLTNIIVGVPA